MRIQIQKGSKSTWVKPKDLERFLAKGWQAFDDVQPAAKKGISYKLEADAEVVKQEEDIIEQDDTDLEAPLYDLPTDDEQGEE